MALRAYDRTTPRPPEVLRRWLGLLRSAVFVLLVLAIAGPVFSLLRTEKVPARLVVLVEDSGSMGLMDGAEGTDAVENTYASRWETALSWGAAVDSALAGLGEPVEVVFLRGNGIEPLREFRLDDPVIPPPGNHGTDFVRIVRKAEESAAGKQVKGFLIVSDGQETTGGQRRGSGGETSDFSTGESNISTSAGPAFKVVGVGDIEGSADRIIKDLRFPDTAYEGDEVQVDFAVDHRFADGAVGSSLQARLWGDSGVVAEKSVDVMGRVTPISLSFKPTGSGLQVYRLEVSPMDNERFLDNNQASLAMDIRKERSRVLLLTGSPGWDVRFLAQAAASEERVSLEVVFRSGNGLVFADSLLPWSAPVEANEWEQWDGVVISDWSGALTSQNWDSLSEAVKGGLGLVVVPGEGSGGSRGPALPPPALASLLPVVTTGWHWARGPLFVEKIPSLVGHPILEGLAPVGDHGGSRGVSGLPPLEQVVMTEVQSGSEIILEARRRGQSMEQDAIPFLVAGSPDNGRVVWVGGRHLWELAFWNPSQSSPGQLNPGSGGSDSAGRRLLRNLLVWTATGEENSGLVFTGRQAFFQEGERIKLAAQWRDIRGRPVLDRKLSLRLRNADAGADSGQVRTFAFSRPERNTGYAEVILPPLPPGRYTIQLVGQGDTPVMGRTENLVVTGHSIEATQVRMDRRRLVQLAARHGGSFISAGTTGAREQLLAELTALDWSGEEVARRNRFDFWSGWPFLFLVAVLLGLEWYFRRRNGLL